MSFLDWVMIFLIFEVGLVLIVSIQRPSFPWLITKRDELPTFDSLALQKFIDYSFDPNLGWVRRPGSTGKENGKNGPITFHIGSNGSRVNSFEKSAPVIAAYGDSYAFCRQVEDDETWEVQLSGMQGFGVLNFGVGNYGVDQALLRYESMNLPETVKIVAMAFVPETICRIQSYWKHYLEFGNTFAFKPRFIIDSTGNLNLLENPMRSNEDFAALREKLPMIQEGDGFYKRKFRSHQFRFPFTFSLMRNPLKQTLLISAVAFRGACRSLSISNQKIENLPFTLVMKNNLSDAYQLYGDDKAKRLLSAILLRFKEKAYCRGHIPLVIVMPQLLDLKINKNRAAPYQSFFSELAQQLPVIDLTKSFMETDFERLYINDQYGGHLSVDGNILVAEEVSNWLKINSKLLN